MNGSDRTHRWSHLCWLGMLVNGSWPSYSTVLSGFGQGPFPRFFFLYNFQARKLLFIRLDCIWTTSPSVFFQLFIPHLQSPCTLGILTWSCYEGFANIIITNPHFDFKRIYNNNRNQGKVKSLKKKKIKQKAAIFISSILTLLKISISKMFFNLLPRYFVCTVAVKCIFVASFNEGFKYRSVDILKKFF